MSDPTRYPVPAQQHRVEASIARSRFICTLRRVGTPEEAQSYIREMNQEFADATHNCWAYVAGPPASTSRVGMSDAGEPHGTAGRPMLTVLLHSGVGEIAAVVTRYYGGTKLGTGGLVKAYGGLVQQALESLPRVERVDYMEVTIGIEYANVTVVRQLLETFEGKVVAQEYGAQVEYRALVPRPNVAPLRAALADATRGDGELHVHEPPECER